MQEGLGKISSLVLLLFSFCSFGQEVKVDGGFVQDSLLIGQDVDFWVTASYPTDLEMVFPDSLHTYTPFEFSSKEYFQTQVINNQAFDSTVYSVQSFEIDLVQYLSLPTMILDGSDTTIIKTPLDSILLQELAPMVSDTTKLLVNTNYATVYTLFNYPLMYIIIGALVLITIILLLIFGKKIIRFFRLRKLRKDYESFSDQLTVYISSLKNSPESNTAERALVFWKQYQERLDKFPFTKLTTKEILTQNFTQELEKPLNSIDRLIYGNRNTDTVFQDFQQIEDFTQYRYNKKVEEIRDGK